MDKAKQIFIDMGGSQHLWIWTGREGDKTYCGLPAISRWEMG